MCTGCTATVTAYFEGAGVPLACRALFLCCFEDFFGGLVDLPGADGPIASG